MMKKFALLQLLLWSVLVFAFTVLTPVIVHGQTPIGCPTEPPTAVAVNPTKVRAELPEQTAVLLDGTPAVTGYTFGWYAEGATAPTTSVFVGCALSAAKRNSTIAPTETKRMGI
jgi:hypothetical protein